MPSAGSSLDTIVAEAVQLATDAERSEYLSRTCGDDEPLRRRAESLIAAHFRAGSFLEQPAVAEVHAQLPDDTGTTIGAYHLLEKIGEGGMGVVYVADQSAPVKRRVALKIIKPGMDTREVIARFEAERQGVALMDHPNIARVFDGGATATGRPYFVMELVRGLPITEYCDHAKLSPERRLKLFVQVCRAVQHAHQKGVIHRDLKPSNVLITLHDGEPVPKVIDFGVAKAIGTQLTEHSAYTRFTQMIGTPLYMSPEQAELSGLDIDTRSDVYSLGVLLYELLAGTTPFDSETLRRAGFDEMRRMIREDDPPRPSARVGMLNPQARSTAAGQRGLDERQFARLLCGDLDWVVLKALEKDRNGRYESAGALAADIERHLAHEPVEARRPSAAYLARKFARRHKAAVISTALITLAIVLGAGASLWKYFDERAARRDADDHRQIAELARRESDQQRNAVAQNLYTADMRLGLVDWQAGNLDRLLKKLASHIPRAGEIDLRGWEWHYLQSLCHRDHQTLPDKFMNLRSVAWSPDGRQLAAAEIGDRTRIWDTSNWQVIRTFPFATDGLSWSPDGRYLAGGQLGSDAGVRICDLSSGKIKTLHGHTASIWTTIWNKESTRLYSCGMDGSIRIWELDTGECLHTWRQTPGNVNAMSLSPDGGRLAAEGERHIIIRNVATGELLGTVEHADRPSSCAWSPEGQHLAVGYWSGACAVVRSKDLVRVASWHAHGGNVNDLRWSPDGKTLSTAGDDNLLKLWNPFDGTQKSTLRGHQNCVLRLHWEPGGRRLASLGMDHLFKIWTIPPTPEPRIIPGKSGQDVQIGWGDRPGELLVFDAADESMTTMDIASGGQHARKAVPKGQRGQISASGRWVVAANRVLRPEGGHWYFKAHDTHSDATFSFDAPLNPNGIAFSPDDAYVAFGGWTGLKVWEPRRNRVLFDFECRATHSFAFSPDGKLLAAGGRGQAGVYLFDVAERKLIQKLPLEPTGYGVFAVAWSPDGNRLATGDANGAIEVFDVPTGRKLASAHLHTAHVKGLTWSPDGRRVVSGSRDRTVRVWDPAHCDELLRFDTPGCEVNQLLWSADGRQIVGAGHNGEIRIWDATAGYRQLASEPLNLPEFGSNDRP